jgi:hypothetical protein
VSREGGHHGRGRYSSAGPKPRAAVSAACRCSPSQRLGAEAFPHSRACGLPAPPGHAPRAGAPCTGRRTQRGRRSAGRAGRRGTWRSIAPRPATQVVPARRPPGTAAGRGPAVSRETRASRAGASAASRPPPQKKQHAVRGSFSKRYVLKYELSAYRKRQGQHRGMMGGSLPRG